MSQVKCITALREKHFEATFSNSKFHPEKALQLSFQKIQQHFADENDVFIKPF